MLIINMMIERLQIRKRTVMRKLYKQYLRMNRNISKWRCASSKEMNLKKYEHVEKKLVNHLLDKRVLYKLPNKDIAELLRKEYFSMKAFDR